MLKAYFRFAAALLLAASAAVAEPTQKPWSQGNPTPEEQQALEWLNAARRDPVGTLSSILNLTGSDSVVAGFMLVQAPTTVPQLEQWLADDYQISRVNSSNFPKSEAISNAPLAFYPLLQQQAAALGQTANAPATHFPSLRLPPVYIYPVPTFGAALLNGPNNVFTGPNATGGIADFGPFGGTYAEIAQANLYDSYITPREWILSILTAGYPNARGSLTPFLQQGDPLPGLILGHTRMVGIDIARGPNGSRVLTTYKASNEFLTRTDLPFGTADTVFITGVAYRDNNSNGIYDPGEGVGEVTIAPDHGGWYAVTSASGGYAIPVPMNSGTYTLTATGGPFTGATAALTIGNDSVKADWVLPAAAAALPPQMPVPASDGVNQLVGLSTRGLVQTGDTVLIGGFVIAGPSTSQKKVLIRGVGPSLQMAGFPANECIPATQLQLYNDRSTVIASNAGWTTTSDGGAAAAEAAAQVGDFPLVNWTGGGGDSALVATLSPGAYTAVVSPAPGAPIAYQTGYVGLVEIYDISRTDGSRLVNISTRGLVGPGDKQMIVGCTVAGSGHKRLLIRGVGPTLEQFGLAGVLLDPALTLYDAQGNATALNGDWSNSEQTSQIRALAAASGAFALPEGGVDSALLTLAAPGNTTATISAKAGTPLTGVALVELYEAP